MHNKRTYTMLACAVMTWLTMPIFAADADTTITTRDVNVEANRAQEEAKYESQSTTIITKEDIEKKQAKSLEDVIFSETGVTRTVDAMGRVGVAIRGADPRHTLMLIDGQPVMGSESKYMGGSDEAMRIGAENIERIEIIRGAATAKYGPDAIGGVINIITKAPSDHPTFQLNAEARYHNHEGTDENKNTWPTNFYMRADTGKVGNTKFSIFGSKREIMPVYSNERAYGSNGDNNPFFKNFKPSLRYYGDTKTIGATGEVEFNDNNKLTFRVMNEKEDLQRRNKTTDPTSFDSIIEPMQIFKRNMNRDTYALTYTGKNDKHDWKIDVNYGKMKESNVTSTTHYGKGFDNYSGKNYLEAVDWLEHKQLDVNATMNTQVNDKHLLTYGVGYTDERAEGTRLKNAPKKWVKSINPWDYDKNLYVYNNKGTAGIPASSVHDWLFKEDETGIKWDREREYNNGNSMTFDIGNGKTYTLSYDDVKAAYNLFKETYNPVPGNESEYTDAQKAYIAFGKELKAQNPNGPYASMLPLYYMNLMNEKQGAPYYYKNFQYNGKYYGKDFEDRENQVSGGEARLQKRHAFIQDTWQVNDDTIITPVLRIDHSDLFGTHATANLGMTHNFNGNAHRRLKINAGTGYAEPGMGELYYNWEMYGSSGGSRYGWYWIGNPNLKPEKSVNFDISLEGENNKTYAKASVFHNVINDYMTQYFTGQLIDFAFNGNSAISADRIYSFKNIGKAEITGFEAEVQQRFNDKWSAKLGYAWLHAINKSDPDMPRTLLDRPQHKIDISFNYEDKKHGWKAALWGDYYIHMLDSNSVKTVYTSADRDSFGNWNKKAVDYQKKTFGIWNFMVEKQVNPDATIYVGIDNLFNYRDDDRAYADRTYRIGANIKFGYDAKGAAEKAVKKAAANAQGTTGPSAVDTTADNGTVIMNQGDWFLTRPSDKDAARKQGDVKLIGDYRVRSNMFQGTETTGMRKTSTGSVNEGANHNFKDEPGHGLEQRLRLGVDAQLGDNTNLLVEGSSGNTVDTKYSKADKRGLHDTQLERAELNQKANKWDFTIGRLTEKMGATGYWFGKEYDGVRATWTGDKTQVRIGYGDFSKSTGITDSPYTHAEFGAFMTAPTLDQLLGTIGTVYPAGADDWQNKQIDYQNKFNHAGMIEQIKADGTKEWVRDPNLSDVEFATKKLEVIQELNSILKNAGVLGDTVDFGTGRNWYNETFLPNDKNSVDLNLISSNSVVGLGSSIMAQYKRPDMKIKKSDGTVLDLSKVDSSGRWIDIFRSRSDEFIANSALFKKQSPYTADDYDLYSLNSDAKQLANNGSVNGMGLAVTQNKIRTLQQKGYKIDNLTWESALDPVHGADNIKNFMGQLCDAVTQNYAKHGEAIQFVDSNGNELTREQQINVMYVNFIGGQWTQTNTTGDIILYGRGIIANFAGALLGLGHYSPTSGADVSLPNVPESMLTTGTIITQDYVPSIKRAGFIQLRHKLGNDFGLSAWYLRSTSGDYTVDDNDMDIANVFGLGATWKLGSSRISFDWGVNRSDMGRYLHRRSVYTYDNSHNVTNINHVNDGNPTFWVLRADIGHADTDQPGSWNAFADYKYFQHGSFFGGNGTEALPDRYLDGIRSFTLGAGYVPAKNLLLEAFYTFGAKSTGQRDTLYGPESFTLGDYTRVQVSYKF